MSCAIAGSMESFISLSDSDTDTETDSLSDTHAREAGVPTIPITLTKLSHISKLLSGQGLAH